MSEQLVKWIESWWETAEKPETIEPGQVWTVFHPENSGRPGTMAVVLEKEEGRALVVPLHHELYARAPCEPVFHENDLTFNDKLVAVVEKAMAVSDHAFNKARFLGRLSGEALGRLEASYQECEELFNVVSELQALEAEHGPTGLPEDALDRAFSSGILKLVPEQASFAETARIHNELVFNLLPFHDESYVRKQEAANGVGHPLSMDLNRPRNFYKSVFQSIEVYLSELENELLNAEPGDALLEKVMNRESHEEIKLLSALVYARLENWNDSADKFKSLVGTAKGNEARRGLVWINQNLDSGDKDLAKEIIAEIATQEDATTDKIMAEAITVPFNKFMKIENLDREILRIWQKVGIAILARKRK